MLLASSDFEETKPNKAASGSSDLKKKVAQLKDQKPNQMEDALHGGLEIKGDFGRFDIICLI